MIIYQSLNNRLMTDIGTDISIDINNNKQSIIFKERPYDNNFRKKRIRNFFISVSC